MIDSSTNLINTASNKPHNYHEQSQIDQTLRLREVLKTLPPFAKDYFRAMEPKSSARTRINYAYDIRVFFHFLMENNPVYKNYTMDRFMPRDLENLEPVDIEEYLEYLKVYKRDEDVYKRQRICYTVVMDRQSLGKMRKKTLKSS